MCILESLTILTHPGRQLQLDAADHDLADALSHWALRHRYLIQPFLALQLPTQDWREPLLSILVLLEMMSFDLEMLSISCVPCRTDAKQS